MTQIQLRRSTASNWTSVNPILALGEVGIETDTRKLKFGDGTTAWTGLSYTSVLWADVTGKPAYLAAGSTSAEARTAIELGNVDNTSDSTKNSAAATLTNKDLTSGTNTFPTSLATLTGTQTLTNKDLTSETNSFPTTVVTTTGTQSLSNKTLTAPTVTDYTETVNAIGTVGSSYTLSLSSGTVLTATLTASTTTTFTMPTAVAGKSFTLLLKQAASTGNGAATFSSVKWGGAGAPTITPAAGKMDILGFFSDGQNWYGSFTQGFTP